jgi:hypothetical protein
MLLKLRYELDSNPTLSAILHSKGLKAVKSAATFSATVSLIFPAKSVLARRKAITDEAHQGQPVRA